MYSFLFRKINREAWKFLNYKLKQVDEEKVTATIEHPGLSYADYDYNGKN